MSGGSNAERARLRVVFEEDDLLVVHKPAGLVCHPTKGDEFSSLVSRLRLYLGEDRVGYLINRLDRETSGLVVAAKNPEAASELGRLMEGRGVSKGYLGLAWGHVSEDAGVWEFPLGKHPKSAVVIRDGVVLGGAACQTPFAVLARWRFGRGVPLPVENAVCELAQDFGPHAQQVLSGPTWSKLFDGVRMTLLRLTPKTGRKHQIRIHASHVGHPLLGDKIYGPDEDLYLQFVEDRLNEEGWRRLVVPCHALHAAALQFQWRGKLWSFRSEPESWFLNLLPQAAQGAAARAFEVEI